jgi:hypothetical protein
MFEMAHHPCTMDLAGVVDLRDSVDDVDFLATQHGFGNKQAGTTRAQNK